MLRTIDVDSFLPAQDVKGFGRSHIMDGGRASQRTGTSWLCVTAVPHKTDCDRTQIVLEFATASFTL